MLDKKSIAEVKAYAKPPDAVLKTMSAVMTVLDKKTDWGTAKQELNDVAFLTKIKDFDKDNMTNKTVLKIEKYTKGDPTFTVPFFQKNNYTCLQKKKKDTADHSFPSR